MATTKTREGRTPPLDLEEEAMLRSCEAGEWRPVPNLPQELQRYAAYARATFAKTKRINIRLSEADVHAIHIKAREEGIPYQTLMARVLHKYVTGQLVANA